MLSPVTNRDEAAPPVFQPPPGNPRFPLFDGVRGIAALGIVLIHASLATGANIGTFYGPYIIRLEMVLTFFFITSGFLLYRPYVAGRLGVGRAPRLSSYARNRFLRIVPAYWLALTALAIYPGLGGFWTDHTWAYYAYLQVLDRGWAFGGILPAWSLSVEMSFYILLPLIAWLMLRASRGRTRRAILRREAVMVASLIAVGLGYRVLIRAVEGDDPQGTEWMFLPAWIAHVAIGMGLAVVSAALVGRREHPWLVRLVERRAGLFWLAAAVLYWVVATRIGLSDRYPEPTTTVQWLTIHVLHALVGLAFVVPCVFGDHRTGLPRKVLGNRLVAWFGTISYGVFLYHVTWMYHLKDSAVADIWSGAPMLGLTVATLIVSTACACVSYYVVERPLLRLKKTRMTEPTPPAPTPPPPVAAARAG
jgi:peptidoglycan/LPS O-acetylase OafA/YrhL